MEKNKPTECPKCHERALWKNEGISKKNGKPYANVKCSKCSYLEWLVVEEKASSKPAPEGWQKPFEGTGTAEKVNSELLILEEIQALRRELKQLATIVMSNLGEEAPHEEE